MADDFEKQLEAVVQRMIDNDEPEENIAEVIKQHRYNNWINNPKPENRPITEPTTFWGGVKKSITSGEAAKTGLRGGAGFLQGAVLDVPASVWGSLKSVADLATTPDKGKWAEEQWQGIKSLPGNIYQAGLESAAKPEEFGRIMGQVTGQPLTTAGLSKIPPTAVVRGAGMGVQGLGTAARHNALTGFLPPLTTPRHLRSLERLTGKGLETVGKRMREVGRNTETPIAPTPPVTAPAPPPRPRPVTPQIPAGQSPITGQPIANPPRQMQLPMGPFGSSPVAPPSAPNIPPVPSIPSIPSVPPSIPPLPPIPRGNLGAVANEIVSPTGAPATRSLPSPVEFVPDYTPQADIPTYSGPRPSGDVKFVPDVPFPEAPTQPIPPPALPQAVEWKPPTPTPEPLPPAVEWKPPTRVEPEVQLVDEGGIGLNASGESAASSEAISRYKGMGEKGQTWYMVDKGGNAVPIKEAGGVDVAAPKGYTKVRQEPTGQLTILDDNGGRIPPGGIKVVSESGVAKPAAPAAPKSAATPTKTKWTPGERLKMQRGKHDPVDVLFPSTKEKEAFVRVSKLLNASKGKGTYPRGNMPSQADIAYYNRVKDMASRLDKYSPTEIEFQAPSLGD